MSKSDEERVEELERRINKLKGQPALSESEMARANERIRFLKRRELLGDNRPKPDLEKAIAESEWPPKERENSPPDCENCDEECVNKK